MDFMKKFRIGSGLQNFHIRTPLLKIQQRQRNGKWFQSLLLPPSGSFNSKKF